jgi:hypothetical protein
MNELVEVFRDALKPRIKCLFERRTNFEVVRGCAHRSHRQNGREGHVYRQVLEISRIDTGTKMLCPLGSASTSDSVFVLRSRPGFC